jgi:hypothetical protein
LARCLLRQRISAAKPDGDAGAIGLDCTSAAWGHLTFLLLIAFYVDNGKQLPVWKDLPHVTYWLLPLLSGFRSSFALCCGIRWPDKRARLNQRR